MGRSSVGSLLEGFGAGYDMTGRVLRDTDLMGVARDKSLDDRGRQLAMAGIFDKHGEVLRGAEMRQSVRRDDIADAGLKMNQQRFEWEKRDQEARAAAQADDAKFRESQRAVFEASTIGQRARAYSQEMQKHQAAAAGAAEAAGAGDSTAVAPPPPSVRAPTIGESLELTAAMLADAASKGKAEPAAFIKLAEMQKQVQDEGYGKALQLAQSGAPLTQVVAAFNGSGQVKLDPASIVSDKTVDRGAGVKSRVLTMKGPDGQTMVIDTLAELDALGKADKVFTRAYDANADRRAGAAEGRAAAAYADGASERELKANLAKLGLKATDPNATPEQRQAARDLMNEGRATDQNAPAEVKLAQAWVNPGYMPNLKAAYAKMASLKTKSAQAAEAEIFGKVISDPVMGSEKTATAAAMAYRQFLASQGGGGAPEEAAGPKPASEAEAHAHAKEVIAKGANKQVVNARLKRDGFAPLP